MNEAVRDLGRKTKARSVEERSKRPEIVRLDELTVETQHAAPIVPPITRKRPRSVASRGRIPRARRAPTESSVEARHVDRWMPGIDHLTENSALFSDETASSRWVHVHGIPVGTTSQQLKRYFKGLHPERVYILPTLINEKQAKKGLSLPSPTCRQRLDIATRLDANHQLPRKAGSAIPRYPPTLRVWVQFSSVVVGRLAVERSGEILSVSVTKEQHIRNESASFTHNALGNTASPESDGREEKKDSANESEPVVAGAALGVTALPRFWASRWVSLMAYEAPSVSMALGDVSVHVEQQLGALCRKVVLDALWSRAVDIYESANSSSRASTRRQVVAKKHFWSPGYAVSLSTKLEALANGVSQLERQLSPAARVDPTIQHRDAGVRLTMNALSILTGAHADIAERERQAMMIPKLIPKRVEEGDDTNLPYE